MASLVMLSSIYTFIHCQKKVHILKGKKPFYGIAPTSQNFVGLIYELIKFQYQVNDCILYL